jgi:polar amino acid transport system substrate-binding protein
MNCANKIKANGSLRTASRVGLVALVALMTLPRQALAQSPAPADSSQAAPSSKPSATPQPSSNASAAAHAAQAQGAEQPGARAGHRAVTPRADSDTLVAIEKSGTLRVGVALIIPWAMHDKDGQLIGFEIDVAKKLARDLGVKPEFHPTPLGELVPDLVAGKFDIIVSGLSITAERALRVDFSNPYNETEVKLLASAKSPVAGAASLDAFNKDAVKIGVLEGSTAEDMAGVVLTNAQIIDYTDSGTAFNDLVEGKLDAAVADSPRPEIVAQLFPDKVKCLCDQPLSTYPAAFAVPRGDVEFVNYLNAWIASRTSNKWLERKRDYWFKSTEWQSKL